MNAMIFAAGLGTRLRPLTNDRPKALVEVAGKTLLEHNILKLKSAGFEHIVVNIHHFGDQIINFLQAHNNFGIDIRVCDERQQLLDTGGGIKAAIPLFDNQEPVLIHNVDIISDIDLFCLYEQHLTSAAQESDKPYGATLAVNQRNTQRYLLFDQSMSLCGWTNVSTGEYKPESFRQAVESGTSHLEDMYRFAFSGIHVVDPQLLSFLAQRPEAAFPIMDFYLNTCQRVKLKAVDVTGIPWVDCGKPESLVKAAQIINNK